MVSQGPFPTYPLPIERVLLTKLTLIFQLCLADTARSCSPSKLTFNQPTAATNLVLMDVKQKVLPLPIPVGIFFKGKGIEINSFFDKVAEAAAADATHAFHAGQVCEGAC